jgi:hypothetical protein
MTSILNKAIFATLCLCILVCFAIRDQYHHQMKADAAKLATEIKAAREEAREMAHNPAIQKALLDREIRELEPMLPAAALQPIKTRAR